MKYTAASFIAFFSISSAIPLPQFGLAGSGSPWGNLFGGGLGSGTNTATLPAGLSTPASQNDGAVPNRGGGAGTIGGNCTPQGSGGGPTEDGVANKNCCTDITIIFARGTGEMGDVGMVVGPPMFEAIRASLGADRVTVQGVDYPASIGGNANAGADGGGVMANLVATAVAQCPHTRIIVSGYSQGSMVVHNAFNNGLSSSNVAAAILFGDPLISQAIGDLSANKIQQFCGTADALCGGGGNGGAVGGHMDYASSASAAASFAIQAAGLA